MGMKPSTQTSAGLVQQYNNEALKLIESLYVKIPMMTDLYAKLAALGNFDVNSISHNSLLNRNVVDAHDMSAITGLTAALNNLTLNKVSVAVGFGLSKNDFSDSYKSMLDGLTTSLAGKANVSHTHSQSDIVGLSSSLANKQDTLVSGISIKTVNGVSLLGSGNVVISGGSTDHSTLTNRTVADAHNIASITGLQTALDGKASTAVATTTVDGLFAFADKVKLNGIAAGATANSADATLLSRANHTGTQATSTITGLDTALAGKQATLVSGTNIKTINGVALLGSGDIAISGGGTTDHSVLTNRSIADAHPISSITNLQSTLDSKAGTAVATTTVNGLMSNADKTKLEGIATGATANTGTVTSVSGTGTVSGLTLTGSVTTSGSLTLGGTLAVTPSNFSSQTANLFLAAPNGSAGVPTFRAIVAADIPTLNQNTTGSAGSVAWANVTGKTNATTSADGLMSLADKTKVDGIAAGATVNSTDAALRDRSTHTGTQAISTVTGLQAALDAKQTADALLRKIHVGTTAPADTTLLWLDTN